MKAAVDPEKADALFLYYYFSSDEQQQWILANATQAGVPHTNLVTLRAHPIRLPSLPNSALLRASLLSQPRCLRRDLSTTFSDIYVQNW